MKDGLFKQPGSRFWYVQYRHNGKTKRVSTKCTRESDAKTFRDNLRGGLAKGTYVPNARKVTYEDLKKLFEDAATARGNKSRPKWKHLDDVFAGALALDVAAQVDSYEAERLKSGAARATVNQELAALRRMFNLARKKKLLSHDQMPVIETPDPHNARQRVVTDHEYQKIHDALPPYLRGVWEFMNLTGWRISEVLGLTWKQVDKKHHVVRLEDSKNGEAREFPFDIYPPLKKLLERQLASGEPHSAHHIFHREGRPVSYDAWNWARNVALKAAGVEDAWAHDLRRRAVMLMERQGIPRSVAMKLTGHKTESMYRRYAIADHAAQVDGVKKLAAAFTKEGAAA